MGFFKRKKAGILDLTDKYSNPISSDKKILKKDYDINSQSNNTEALGFFSAIANNATPKESTSHEDSEGHYLELNKRKQKLTKRLLDMTTKIEELSNQIYRLQQRVELIEKKLEVNRF